VSDDGSVEGLRAESAGLRAEVAALTSANELLAGQVVVLTGKIAELEKRLSKDSSNSSKPPSSDRFKKPRPESPNRAARRAEGRKPGKQPGTDGKHLAQIDDPDDVELHVPGCCDGCGGDLAEAPVEAVEVRQVFDLPDPRLHTVEHRAETRRCGCGTKTKAVFPADARSYASYGPKLRAVALYLLAYQHLPFERCQATLRDLFAVDVSTGFLDSLFTEGGDGLVLFMAAVLGHLLASDVVHVDETFDHVGKKKAYIHVVCSELYTFLHADETRGKDGTERTGLFPDYTGTAVHDRLVQYFGYTNATHAVCAAHLIRELVSVGHDPVQRPWASAMTALLYTMNTTAHAARAAGASQIDPDILAKFIADYDQVVADALDFNPAPGPGLKRSKLEAESYNLAVAFRDHRDAIRRFATDLRVPFTNNRAESDLRMVKLHSKISGPFRNMAGAERFATVRSYLSTARKHHLGPFQVLTALFAGQPWIPQRI
jgi:transposase